jgi:hypothetical protein
MSVTVSCPLCGTDGTATPDEGPPFLTFFCDNPACDYHDPEA